MHPIGFTGTPIELTDKNTRAVFGDYIASTHSVGNVTDAETNQICYRVAWLLLLG